MSVFTSHVLVPRPVDINALCGFLERLLDNEQGQSWDERRLGPLVELNLKVSEDLSVIVSYCPDQKMVDPYVVDGTSSDTNERYFPSDEGPFYAAVITEYGGPFGNTPAKRLLSVLDPHAAVGPLDPAVRASERFHRLVVEYLSTWLGREYGCERIPWRIEPDPQDRGWKFDPVNEVSDVD